MSNNYTRQYEAPVKPQNWTGDALRFYRMLIDVLDDIYLKYGRIDEKMIGSALREKINSKADNGTVAEIVLEQGKLSASFTSLSGEVTQLAVDVDGIVARVTDEIAGVNSTISQTAEAIRSEVTAEVNGLQSQIDQTPGKITAAVSDASNKLQSQIDQTPGLISAAVGGIEIGGTNLLRETGWYTEVAPRSVGWIYTYGAFIKYPYDTLPDRDDFYENGFIHWTGEQSGDCNTPRLKVKEGEVYTLSFRHRGAGLNVYIVGLNPAGIQTWGAEKAFGNPVTTDCSFLFSIPSGYDASSIFIVFRTTAGEGGVLGRIKLERGNKATAWSPNPLDNSRGVQNGSNLLITDKVVRINTPELEINVSGGDGDAHFGAKGFAVDVVSSPSVRKRYTGPTALTIGVAGVDGVNCFAALGDAFAKLSDCHIPNGVTIRMSSTTTSLTEDQIELKNITGAPVVVEGGGVTLNATVKLSSCKNQAVHFKNLVISNAMDTPVTIEHCDLVYWTESCKLVGTGQTYGMLASGSGIYMHSSELHRFHHAIWLMENSNACIDNCSGSYNTYALVLRSNSRAGLAVKRPFGGISTDASCSMSSDPGAGESATPSTPAATTTVTLTATNTRTYAGGWYSGTNVLSQGASGGTTFQGFMWFDTSAIAGKTIKSAAIRLYRRAGVGSGNPVKVLVGSHNASGPSGAVNIVSSFDSYVVGMVDQKEEIKASISAEAVQQIANGSAKGLYIHSDSNGYAQFDGFDGEHPPKLLVTYS